MDKESREGGRGMAGSRATSGDQPSSRFIRARTGFLCVRAYTRARFVNAR